METRKTYEELEAENRILRSTDKALILAPIAINFIRWGGLCVISYFGYAAIAALSGKVTLSSIGINFLSNVSVSSSLAWLLGGGGIIYGLRERKLRQRTVLRMDRIPELETNIDPDRTSSSLGPGGMTHPRDRE